MNSGAEPQAELYRSREAAQIGSASGAATS